MYQSRELSKNLTDFVLDLLVDRHEKIFEAPDEPEHLIIPSPKLDKDFFSCAEIT